MSEPVDKFSPLEKYILYIAACSYERQGCPGLDEQEDQGALDAALNSALNKLSMYICGETSTKGKRPEA